MAKELNVTFNGTGANLYALIRNNAAQVWNGSAFVTFSPANLSSYAIVLTDQGGDMYTADAPVALPGGRYLVQYYYRVGGSPSTTDELLITKALLYGVAGGGSGSGGPYLTNLANVKTYMGITGGALDARLNQLIPLASALVQEYCERDFFSGTFTERYDGNAIGLNGGWLLLNNVPVTSITSVKFWPDSDWAETLDGSQFIFDPASGLVKFDPDSDLRRPWTAGFRNIEVTYTAGFADIPIEVDTATAMVVSALYAQSSKDPSALRERIGDYEYYGRTGADGGGPWDVLRNASPILDKYKRITFSA